MITTHMISVGGVIYGPLCLLLVGVSDHLFIVVLTLVLLKLYIRVDSFIIICH